MVVCEQPKSDVAKSDLGHFMAIKTDVTPLLTDIRPFLKFRETFTPLMIIVLISSSAEL